MTNRIEGLNNDNAAFRTLKVRVMHPFSRSPTDKMSLFGVYLLSETGAYTLAETTVFGDEANRNKILQKLEQTWMHNSAWELSKLKATRKNPKFHSCPHPYIIALNDPKMKKQKLDEAGAKNLPTELEPPIPISEIQRFSISQCVDTFGVITTLPEVKTQQGKTLIELILCDKDGMEIGVNFWNEHTAKVAQFQPGDLVYILRSWLTKKDGGSCHLTVNATTLVIKASGDMPLAKELATKKVTEMDAKDKHSLSAATEPKNWMEGEAVSTNASTLEFLTSFKSNLPDEVFEIAGACVSLQPAGDDGLLTKHGDRIWTQVAVMDFSGCVPAWLTQAAALVLSDQDSKDEFITAAPDGSLNFQRGRLRLRWACGQSGTSPRLTVVGAECRCFDIPAAIPTLPSDEKLVPGLLQWASPALAGNISMRFPGADIEVLAAGILVVVRGVKEPESEVIPDGFAIRNFIADHCAEENPVKYEAMATAPTSRLPRYSIPKKELALVHVTHIAQGENKMIITVADVWRLPNGQDLTIWKQEFAKVVEVLTRKPLTLKRKASDLDTGVQTVLGPGKKRIYKQFGDQE